MARKSFEANKFHMVLRSHGRRRETSIKNLPEEIIFMILALLPAEMLWNVVRYVCRQWYALIQDPRFVSRHNLSSTSTLLMHSVSIGYYSDVYHLLDVRDCDVRLTDFKIHLPRRVPVRATCNGLLLMEDMVHKRYYVGNPITRRLLALPKLSSFMSPLSFCCSIAFEDSSKVYKAVVVFLEVGLGSKTSESGVYKCAILTVGVDKAWRVLNLTHLENKEKDKRFLLDIQVPVTGFIYWFSHCDDPYSFALDLESEIMKPIRVPFVYPKKFHALPKGNSISLMVATPDFSSEVWVLKDHRSEQWVKFHKSKPIRNECENIMSGNNLRKHHVTLDKSYGRRELMSSFVNYGEFFVYDLNTHACVKVDTKLDEGHYYFPFIASLAWV